MRIQSFFHKDIKMALGTDEYKRFQLIDEFFASGKRATVKELAEYFDRIMDQSDFNLTCGFSDKILYKVLNAMRDELNAPLQKDNENRFYYSSTKTLTKPGFLSREETGKTIRMINHLLETIKDSPIYEEAAKLCSDITNEAPLIDRYGKEMKNEMNSAPNRVIFLGAPASDVRDSIWSDIYKTMEDNYHISIKYVAPGHTESVSRGVRPYQLIFDDGIWDLWGYDCVKKQNHLYNLSRIKSVEIKTQSERFVLPADYDFHKITPGTFGCYRDTDTPGMCHYRIRLAKGSYAESFARERVWGLNPQIEETESGTVISFDDNQYLPILRWVLGWGPDAEPLEPAQLVDDWKDRIKKMTASIKKKR